MKMNKKFLSVILTLVLFLGTTGNVFAANQSFIDKVKNEYTSYESKTSKDYSNYEENTSKLFEEYKKKQASSYESFVSGTKQDVQRINQILSQDIERLEKSHSGSTKLRDYKNKVNPNFLGSPMQKYVNSVNPDFLSSFMQKYKNAVNENYLSSPMQKYKNAVNENFLSSPMQKYKNAVNESYLSSPMQKLKNGSNVNFLGSIMQNYKNGKITQQEASKQWNTLFQSESKSIQTIISQSKESMNQVAGTTLDSIRKQQNDTVNGILEQREKSLKEIAAARAEYFGEGITFGSFTPNLGEINVIIDGEWLAFEQPPTIINGSTLVPMRAIFEKLNASVVWNGQTKSITATKGTTKISLTLDKNTATKNGKAMTLDTPPKLINGHTMVPIRFVSESLGADVKWDGASKTVFITSK
ncbi:copper amine oxidase N-terminal domain-containing protein [bacterium LRH843]|nr:copper amine oxidase N-terminal domain-containing protein [bacterium LRH843]